MSNKLPAFQFYPGDWLKDPNLSMCCSSTRGIWIDLLCAMHESNRSGQIAGTAEQLSRICRCTAVQIEQALKELESTCTAGVIERDKKFTVINRRMKRQNDLAKIRGKAGKAGMEKRWSKKPDNKTITKTPTSSSSSSSLSPSRMKEKESEKKKKFVPPTLAEVEKYIAEKGYDVNANKFMEYFTESSWIDSNGKKVRNWKQKIITWSGNHNVRNSNKNKRNFAEQKSEFGQTI